MTPMTDQAKPLSECLGSRTGTLASVLQRAAWLVKIQEGLRAQFREPWASELRVANIRDHALILHASSAGTVSRARFHANDMLAFLNERFGLSCQRMEIHVVPPP
jgi:hypothetical protein